MKILKNLGLAASILFFTSSSFANNVEPVNKKDVRLEITKILKTMDLEEENFKINFMVNSKGELIVVSTTSEKNDRLIRDTINYKKVGETNTDVHTIYTVPVTIEKK